MGNGMPYAVIEGCNFSKRWNVGGVEGVSEREIWVLNHFLSGIIGDLS